MQVIKNIRLKFGNIMLCFIISILCFSNVSALTAEETVDFNFTFNPSLSISLSSDELVIENLVPGNYANSNTISINVQTNNRNGYTLTAEVGDSETAALANNSLVNTISNTTFTSIANNASTALASFAPNYWGYTTSQSIDSSTKYSGLLYGATTTLNQTVDPSGRAVGNYRGGTVTNFTIGASAGSDQTSGEYTNIISFNIVPNVSTDITINSIKYMQDIAKLNPEQRTSVLNSMTLNSQYQLIDNRDNEVYNVAKLADGNLWLQDNLRLGGTSAINLTPANTNIVDNFTLPASVSTDFNSYTEARINADSKDAEEPLALEQTGTNTVGVYYNYCAASGGTYCMDETSGFGNAKYDICPAGWRMPTGGASGEYQNLSSKYADGAALVNALKTPLSGRFYDDAALVQGTYGGFWSTTKHSSLSTSMYDLATTTSVVQAQGYVKRYYAMSVRCMVDRTKNMQDVTNSELATMLPNAGDTVTLRDSRDGKRYSVTNVAGLYWMTTNLDLVGGTVLTTEKSNTNYTLPASSTSGFDDNSTAYVYNSGSTTCENNSPCYSYYSWVAATAGGSSNICPKGWRLPTSNEFTALKNVYTTGATLTGSPWYGVYAGRYDNSSFGYGNYGFYWSATAYDTSNAYDLNFLNSNADVGYNGKRNGFSVRCVKAS